MVDLYDARALPQRERMAFWLDTVCTKILPVSIDPRHDAAPVAAMSCAAIGEMAIRSVVGGDHVYVRRASEIRSGDPDTLQVGVPLAGTSLLVQDGREAALNPGDMVLYDSSRPFTLVMQDRFSWQVFLFPKFVLGRSAHELSEITAIPLRPDRGVNALVGRFLRGLAQDSSRLESDSQAIELGRHAADLTATMVDAAFGTGWGVADANEVLRTRIADFIRRHHHDPSLSPAAIATAHNVSVRSLHAVYVGTGDSVMDVVRTCRLKAIRADLLNPRLNGAQIAEIAAAHGIHSTTTLGRLFHSAFGVSPSDLRAGAAAVAR